MISFVPWRDDCGTYRNWNPCSGNFSNGLSSSDLSRSNWCPGTVTNPEYIYLGDLEAGEHSITVKYHRVLLKGKVIVIGVSRVHLFINVNSLSCGNRNVSVIAGQGVFQLFYLLKGQLCALCNLPHSKFKDLRLRLRLIGTSFSLSLFLSMFFYSFFQLGRIQHIILNHQDVHILVVCMAFLRKAYSTADKHRFNQSEYTLPAILSHFIDKRYIFSSNRQTA